MSLDVYLIHTAAPVEPRNRIFVRRDGQTVEVTSSEWDESHPGVTPVAVWSEIEDVIFQANITHNLGKMADEVGLYQALWRPEEIGATKAAQIIPLLQLGLARLGEERERLQQFNPANGWGDYDLLVRFTVGYLLACEQFPDATIEVSR